MTTRQGRSLLLGGDNDDLLTGWTPTRSSHLASYLPSHRTRRVEPRMAMLFTCAKCDTRSVKTFSKRSYESGVVLVGYVIGS